MEAWEVGLKFSSFLILISLNNSQRQWQNILKLNLQCWFLFPNRPCVFWFLLGFHYVWEYWSAHICTLAGVLWTYLLLKNIPVPDGVFPPPVNNTFLAKGHSFYQWRYFTGLRNHIIAFYNSRVYFWDFLKRKYGRFLPTYVLYVVW